MSPASGRHTSVRPVEPGSRRQRATVLPSISAMADTGAKAIDDIDRLVVALDELAAQLVVSKRQYRKAARSLRAGDRVATALAKADAGQTRESIVVSLDEFERRRHVSRLSLIAAGLEDGKSIAALSQALGGLPPADLEVRQHDPEGRGARRGAIGVAPWSEVLVAPGSIYSSVASL